MPKTVPAASRVNILDSTGIYNDGTPITPANMEAAMNAAASGDDYLHVPAGTYNVNAVVNAPDGLYMYGDGADVTRMNMKLRYGSNSHYYYMHIGGDDLSDDNCTWHQDGATITAFTECKFRGVIPLKFGSSKDGSNLQFIDCDIECALGIYDPGVWGEAYHNNVNLEEDTGHLEYLYFTRCNFGVFNGERTGSPGFNMVLHCSRDTAVPVEGYDHIYITDCVFEVADSCCLDIQSDYVVQNHSASDIEITNCLFKGGGAVQADQFGYTVVVEGPDNVTIRGCTLWHGRINTFKVCNNETYDSTRGPTIFENNVIDERVNNGIYRKTNDWKVVKLAGDNNIFNNNVIHIPDAYTGNSILRPNDMRGIDPQTAQIMGNTIYCYDPTGQPALINATDSENVLFAYNNLYKASTKEWVISDTNGTSNVWEPNYEFQL